jgi:hypothetical protein
MVDQLNSPEVTKVLNELMGGTATIMEKSFAQLYTAEEGKHRFHGSNISGICTIIFDRREGKVNEFNSLDCLLTCLRCFISLGVGEFGTLLRI